LGGETIDIACKDTIGLSGGTTEDEFLLILQPEPLVNDSTIEATLLLIECELTGTIGKKCAVPVEKATAKLTGTVEENENNVLFQAAGGVWLEFLFENKGVETCPATLKGNSKKLTGEDLCVWSATENPILEDLEEHLLNCTEGGGLSFAEQPAKFDANYGIVLEHEPFWDIEES
jgi:hypothetical protein